jgi:hypothetical protein
MFAFLVLVTLCLAQEGGDEKKASLTSAVESQFFIFGVGKSYRFNKSLRNGENSDEYE